MISIIKTAIITIIISVISGLLLEYYKNLGPRILCNIGNGIPIERNNKKIYAYIITVTNISNKTIHDLTLNIQSPQNNLKIEDAKITRGLKFDSSIEDNILDVYIPFLSKDDEFSVKLYAENEHGIHNKPVIIIRSPENFKRIDSEKQNGILSLLFNIPKSVDETTSDKMKKSQPIVPNKKDDFTIVMDKVSEDKKLTNKEVSYKSKKNSKNKRAMIVTASIVLVMIIGVLGKFYFKEMPANKQTHSVKTNVNKHSTEAKGSTGEETKDTDAKASTGETNKNTDVKASSSGKTKNTDAKTNVNKQSIDSKGSTGTNTKNADIKGSTDGTNKNINPNTPTDDTNKNTSTGGTTGSPDTKTSTDGADGSTGN